MKVIFFFIFLFPSLLFAQANQKEDFTSFLYQFSSDSLFQINRIQFPLTFITLNYEIFEEVEKKIQEKDWRFETVFPAQERRAQVYDNFDRELRDSDERVFSWHGIDNGINIHYFFKRINGKWFLVKYEDTST